MRNGTIISLLVFMLVVGCDRNEGIKVENEAPQVLQLELKKDKKGADVLVLATEGLPQLNQESKGYNLYLCWVDEPAPPGGYPHEKRIELRGGAQGEGAAFTVGLNAHLFDLGTSYYGRGRVCVIAVSDDESYISNVVRVPNKPDTGDGG